MDKAYDFQFMEFEDENSEDEFVTPVKLQLNSYTNGVNKSGKADKKGRSSSIRKHKAGMQNKRGHIHEYGTISETSVSSSDEDIHIFHLSNSQKLNQSRGSLRKGVKIASHRLGSDTEAHLGSPSSVQPKSEEDKSDASTIDLFNEDDTIPESDVIAASNDSEVVISETESEDNCETSSLNNNKITSHLPAESKSQKSLGMAWLSAKSESSQNPRASQKNTFSLSSSEDDSDSESILHSQSLSRKTPNNSHSKETQDIFDTGPGASAVRRQAKVQSVFKSLQKNKNFIKNLVDKAKGKQETQSSQKEGGSLNSVHDWSKEFNPLHSVDTSFEDVSPTFSTRRKPRLSLKRRRHSTDKKEATETNISQAILETIDSDSDVIIMSDEDTLPLTKLDSTTEYPVSPETIKGVSKDSTISYPITPKRMALINPEQKQKVVPSSLHSSESFSSAGNLAKKFPLLSKSRVNSPLSQEVPFQGKTSMYTGNVDSCGTSSTKTLHKRRSSDAGLSLTSLPSPQKKPSNLSENELSEDDLSMPVLTQYPKDNNSQNDSEDTIDWFPLSSRLSHECVPDELKANSENNIKNEKKTGSDFLCHKNVAGPETVKNTKTCNDSLMFSQNSSSSSGISQDIVKILGELTESGKSPVQEIGAIVSQKFISASNSNIAKEDMENNKVCLSNGHHSSNLDATSPAVSVFSSEKAFSEADVKKEVDSAGEEEEETEVNFSLMDEEIYCIDSDDEKIYMSQCTSENLDEQEKDVNGPCQVKVESPWWNDENKHDAVGLEGDKVSNSRSNMSELFIDLSDIPDSDDESYLLEASQGYGYDYEEMETTHQTSKINELNKETGCLIDSKLVKTSSEGGVYQDQESNDSFQVEKQKDIFVAQGQVRYASSSESDGELPDLDIDTRAHQNNESSNYIKSSTTVSQLANLCEGKPKETANKSFLRLSKRTLSDAKSRTKTEVDPYELDTDIDSPSAVDVVFDESVYDMDTELDEDFSDIEEDSDAILYAMDTQPFENSTKGYSDKTHIKFLSPRGEGLYGDVSQEQGNQNQEDSDELYLQPTLIDSPLRDDDNDEVTDNVFNSATQVDRPTGTEISDSQCLEGEEGIDYIEALLNPLSQTEEDQLLYGEVNKQQSDQNPVDYDKLYHQPTLIGSPLSEDDDDEGTNNVFNSATQTEMGTGTEKNNFIGQNKAMKSYSHGVTEHNIVDYMAATQVDQGASTDKQDQPLKGKRIQLFPKHIKTQIYKSDENVFEKLTAEFKSSSDLSSKSSAVSSTSMPSRRDLTPMRSKQLSSLEREEEAVNIQGYVSEVNEDMGNSDKDKGNYQTNVTVKADVSDKTASKYLVEEATGIKQGEDKEKSEVQTDNLKKDRTHSSSSSGEDEVPFDFFSMQTLVDDAPPCIGSSESDTDKDAGDCDISIEKHKSYSDDSDASKKTIVNDRGKIKHKDIQSEAKNPCSHNSDLSEDPDQTLEYGHEETHLRAHVCDDRSDVKLKAQPKVSHDSLNAQCTPDKIVASECVKGKDVRTKAKESFDCSYEDPDQTLEYGDQEIHVTEGISDFRPNALLSVSPEVSGQASKNLSLRKSGISCENISNNEDPPAIEFGNIPSKDSSIIVAKPAGLVKSNQERQFKDSNSAQVAEVKDLSTASKQSAQLFQKVVGKRADLVSPNVDSRTAVKEKKNQTHSKKVGLEQQFKQPDSRKKINNSPSLKKESDKNKLVKSKGWISATKQRTAVKRPSTIKTSNASHSKAKKSKGKFSEKDNLAAGIKSARELLQNRLKNQTNKPVIRDRRPLIPHFASNDDDDVDMPCTQEMMAQGLPILERHYLVDKSRLSHKNTDTDHCNVPMPSDTKRSHVSATLKAPSNPSVIKNPDKVDNSDTLNDKTTFKSPAAPSPLSAKEAKYFHPTKSSVPAVLTKQADSSDKIVSLPKSSHSDSKASDSKGRAVSEGQEGVSKGKAFSKGRKASQSQAVNHLSESGHSKPLYSTTSPSPLQSAQALEKATSVPEQNAVFHSLPPSSHSTVSHGIRTTEIKSVVQQSPPKSGILKQSKPLSVSVAPNVQAFDKATPSSKQNAVLHTSSTCSSISSRHQKVRFGIPATDTNSTVHTSALKSGVLKQTKPIPASVAPVHRKNFMDIQNENKWSEQTNQTKYHPRNRPSTTSSMSSHLTRSAITPNEARMDFMSGILGWNPDWLITQEKNTEPPQLVDQNKSLQRLTLYYTSFKEYYDITRNLLILEVWETIFQDWKSSRKSQAQSKFKILNLKMPEAPGEYSKRGLLKAEFIGIVARADFRKLPAIGDLLIMDYFGKKKGDKDKSQSQPSWHQQFAIVKQILTENMGLSFLQQYPLFTSSQVLEKEGNPVVFRLIMDIRYRGIFYKELFVIRAISSLKTSFRQLEALANLPENKLCEQLLNPQLSKAFYHNPVKPSNDLTLRLNKEQATAVATICRAVQDPKDDGKIFLLQGPPGTGKSHTILSLIHNVLLTSGFKARICLATPSNAAVDELAKRIAQFSHKLKAKGQQNISLVRVGNLGSIHQDVQPYFLETLVQERHKRNSLRNVSLREELSMYETQLADIQKLLSGRTLPRAQEAVKRAESNEIKKKINNIKADVAPKKITPRERYNCQCQILDSAHVVCGTLSSFGAAEVKHLLLQGDIQRHQGCPFSLMIIDEATQAIEVDCLIPLQYKMTKVVLVGDEKQLPATVKSKLAIDKQLNRSLFERLFVRLNLQLPEISKNDPSFVSPIMTLVKQYRMHSEILSLPNTFFYQDKLETDVSVSVRKSVLSPYLVFDIQEGKESIVDGGNNGSIANKAEATCTAELCLVVMEALKERPDTIHKKIGVICPYADQKRTIMQQLRKSGLERIEVNTVDGFQGQEREVIIMSCVRAQSNPTTIGFVADMKRMNVALTRAKQAMYVLGHFETLSTDELWNELYKNASERNLLVPVVRTSDFYRLGRKAVSKNHS